VRIVKIVEVVIITAHTTDATAYQTFSLFEVMASTMISII